MRAEEELGRAITDLRGILQESGLDPFPTRFEIAPVDGVCEMAAYGVPGAFSHWTKGAEYYKERTRHRYNVSKIYELVINSNPSYAFLLDTNTPIQNKLVAAHVFGHTDFFKRNISFADTDRQILDTASAHARRLDGYRFKYGEDVVEQFLDAALSIEWNVEETGDPKRWASAQEYRKLALEHLEEKQKAKLRSTTPYDDLFDLEDRRPEPKKEKPPFPVEEEGNLLMFIALHSRSLEEWQRDILTMIHAEAKYFHPQRLTKIMNEGWATYWHVAALRECGNRGGLTQAEQIEWPILHAGVVSPNRLRINPYYIGYHLWEDIARRSRGEPLPGEEKEYDFEGNLVNAESYKGRSDYDIFWVRESVPSDQAFLRNYLTPNFINRFEAYAYAYDGQDWVVTERNPKKVRDTLVASLTNFGLPVIRVTEGGADYNGNDELYLVHKDEGQGVDIERAKRCVQNIFKLWGRVVYLEALEQYFEEVKGGSPWVRPEGGEYKERKVLLSCKDGQEVEVKEMM